MDENKFKEKFVELMNDEEFCSKLQDMEEREQIEQLFRTNGLELSKEIIDSIMIKMEHYNETGELDEDTLAVVAGGGRFEDVIGCAGLGGLIGATYGGPYGAVAGIVAGCVVYVVLRRRGYFK